MSKMMPLQSRELRTEMLRVGAAWEGCRGSDPTEGHPSSCGSFLLLAQQELSRQPQLQQGEIPEPGPPPKSDGKVKAKSQSAEQFLSAMT